MSTPKHSWLSPLVNFTRKCSCSLPTSPLARQCSPSLSQQFLNFILVMSLGIPNSSSSHLSPFHSFCFHPPGFFTILMISTATGPWPRVFRLRGGALSAQWQKETKRTYAHLTRSICHPNCWVVFLVSKGLIPKL
ncbi:unnamed protein product [Ectocarpus sp. 8 AP-2014]